MTAFNNNKRKELKEISRKRLPGFGPAIDVREAVEMARKLSQTLGKYFKPNMKREE